MSVPDGCIKDALAFLVYMYTVFWIAAMPMVESDSKKADEILEYAIQYAQDSSYPPKLTKKKERADSERAAFLTIDKGEVFFNSVQ